MFIDEDFLLATPTARRLYHDYAKEMPIIDYHCHLDPELIANNYRFRTITELWLDGDHYKWRAMRANGIEERRITGEASDWEKFEAWAETVESLIGNALYHWTHLELKRYFNVTDVLNKQSAKQIYDQCNRYLVENEITTQSLITESDVRFIGTTDDILSDLAFHRVIQETTPLKVAPSFRPDPVININPQFVDYIAKCKLLAQDDLTTFSSLISFLKERVDYFHERGCKSADHGFEAFLFEKATDDEIETIYQKALQNHTLTELERAKWQGRILTELGRAYAHKGWIMQLHFGAIRNNSTRLYRQLGTDIGIDSIYDQSTVAHHLNAFLDELDITDELPKTILYNLNPMINDVVATICGNYQANEQGIKSKVQFGAGWWFADTYTGMINQMETLSNQGILMNFVGMLTDSRSFTSYPRHDYFRRILCQYVGERVESGFYPDDEGILKDMIEKITFYNVEKYFELTAG